MKQNPLVQFKLIDNFSVELDKLPNKTHSKSNRFSNLGNFAKLVSGYQVTPRERVYLQTLEELHFKVTSILQDKQLAQKGFDYLTNKYKDSLKFLIDDTYYMNLIGDYGRLLLDCVYLGLTSEEAFGISGTVVDYEFDKEKQNKGQYEPNYQNHPILEACRFTQSLSSPIGVALEELIEKLGYVAPVEKKKKPKPEFKSWQQPWKYHK